MTTSANTSEITIYSDGSCSPNPGPGGWGAVLLFDGDRKVIELSGNEEQATNNRMELLAALSALQSLDKSSNIEVVTDSRYLQRGITEWLQRWQKNGWRTVDGLPVKNRDLWLLFYKQVRHHSITWSWIKGHSKNSWNERADALAAAARQTAAPALPVHDADGVHIYPGVTWKNSSGVGSWAVVMNYRNHYRILGGKSEETTANQLYLHGVIVGLRSLKRSLPVYIYTRSGYLRDGLTTWIEGWRKRNWQTREGAEVSNNQQWRELARFKDAMVIRVVSFPADAPLCHAQEAKELAREFDGSC